MRVRNPAGALTFYDLRFAPWFLPQPIKSLRQRKILPRQPTFVVRGEGERHLVPADVDVGMMPDLLGEAGHGVDEPDGCREILELVSARDALRLPPPLRDGWQRVLDLFRG